MSEPSFKTMFHSLFKNKVMHSRKTARESPHTALACRSKESSIAATPTAAALYSRYR